VAGHDAIGVGACGSKKVLGSIFIGKKLLVM
jgi:hypothetical protein